MVLPSCGGVHWVEFEGFPHESHIIKESLQWTHDLFNDREPTVREYNYGNWSHEGFVRFCESLNQSSQFFKYLYTIVPSVYGKSREGQDELTQEIRTEIASTRRCRQLSTYSQVATLLSTCQTSRLAALDYLSKMVPNGSLPIYRGSGPLYRWVTISLQCSTRMLLELFSVMNYLKYHGNLRSRWLPMIYSHSLTLTEKQANLELSFTDPVTSTSGNTSIMISNRFGKVSICCFLQSTAP